MSYTTALRDKRGRMSHRFGYMLESEIVDELARLGILFIAADLGNEEWPALLLPSGKVLTIQQDDEGNGPGAIHWSGTIEGKAAK